MRLGKIIYYSFAHAGLELCVAKDYLKLLTALSLPPEFSAGGGTQGFVPVSHRQLCYAPSPRRHAFLNLQVVFPPPFIVLLRLRPGASSLLGKHHTTEVQAHPFGDEAVLPAWLLICDLPDFPEPGLQTWEARPSSNKTNGLVPPDMGKLAVHLLLLA